MPRVIFLLVEGRQILFYLLMSRQKEIDVIDGVARLSIPAGVQSGEKIHIKGRGTVDAVGSSIDDVEDGDNRQRRGDHVAVIEVGMTCVYKTCIGRTFS